jgi:hypothetical protein
MVNLMFGHHRFRSGEIVVDRDRMWERRHGGRERSDGVHDADNNAARGSSGVPEGGLHHLLQLGSGGADRFRERQCRSRAHEAVFAAAAEA